MAKRKGMSLEEKRDTMLSLFYETVRLYQLRQLRMGSADLQSDVSAPRPPV